MRSVRMCALVAAAIVFTGMVVRARQSQVPVTDVSAPTVNSPTRGQIRGFGLIKFNGILRDQRGQPLNGPVGIIVAIYKDQEGGAPLWQESQNVLVDSQGNYTVLLGATTGEGIPPDIFSSSEPRWLGITPNLPDSQESPRVLFVSVPYAVKAGDADTVGGKRATDFVLATSTDDNTASGGSETPPHKKGPTREKSSLELNNPVGTPLPGCLVKSKNSEGDQENSVVCESPADGPAEGTNVGIGTAVPTAKIEVNRSGFPVALFRRNFAADASTMRSVASVVLANPGLQAGNGFGPLVRFDIIDSTTGGNIALNNGYLAEFGAVRDGANNSGAFVLRTVNAGVAVERFRLDKLGRVGVGTANPTEKLEVLGNVKATGGQLVSTVPNGTAPLLITSTTQVANLNASFLGGMSADAARTRGIVYLGGCDTCAPLTDADDQKTIYVNVVGPMTISSVTCFSDAGSPSINIQRDDGTPPSANVLGSDLVCSTTGASSTNFAPGESVLNLHDKLDFAIVTAGGVAKRVTVVIQAIVNVN